MSNHHAVCQFRYTSHDKTQSRQLKKYKKIVRNNRNDYCILFNKILQAAYLLMYSYKCIINSPIPLKIYLH